MALLAKEPGESEETFAKGLAKAANEREVERRLEEQRWKREELIRELAKATKQLREHLDELEKRLIDDGVITKAEAEDIRRRCCSNVWR